jgi:hypothetical protein
MKIFKKIKDSLKLFFEILKVNKLIRLVTGIILAAICLKLSEYWDFFWYLAIVFAIYPIWLTFWMFIYAWILNPIREKLPNSWVARKVIPYLDNIVDK